MKDRTCMYCAGKPVSETGPVAHKVGCNKLELWYRKGIAHALEAMKEAIRDSPGLTSKAAEHVIRGLEAQVRIRLPIEDERPHRPS